MYDRIVKNMSSKLLDARQGSLQGLPEFFGRHQRTISHVILYGLLLGTVLTSKNLKPAGAAGAVDLNPIPTKACQSTVTLVPLDQQLVQGPGHQEVKGRLCPGTPLPARINIAAGSLGIEDYPVGLSDQVDNGTGAMGKTVHGVLKVDGNTADGQLVVDPDGKFSGSLQNRSQPDNDSHLEYISDGMGGKVLVRITTTKTSNPAGMAGSVSDP